MSNENNKNQDHQLENRRLLTYLEEYKALRAEQTRRMSNQQNITYILVIVLAGILGFTYQIKPENEEAFNYILLITPILSSALVFVYLDHDIMISRVGRYIHEKLREKVAQVISSEDVWEWDEYHVMESRETLSSLSAISFLSRFILLIIAIIGPLILFFIIVEKPYDEKQKILICIDLFVALLIFCSHIIIIYYFFDAPQKHK